MKLWMEGFLTLMGVDLPVLGSDSEEEPGPMEQLKSAICDNITMYSMKYDEEFQPYLQPFVGVVWNLLVNTGHQMKSALFVFLRLFLNELKFKVLYAVVTKNFNLQMRFNFTQVE